VAETRNAKLPTIHRIAPQQSIDSVNITLPGANKIVLLQGMVVHTCNPSTREAKEGGS
jgi:hypothetical protein